jgi:hypothetical protein
MKAPKRQPKNRGGRPRKRKLRAGEPVPVAFRCSPVLKAAIDDACRQHGRSFSQEVELRVARSFDQQELLMEALTLRFGERLADLVYTIGHAIDGTRYDVYELMTKEGRDFEEHWLNDGPSREVARTAVEWVFDLKDPDKNPTGLLPTPRPSGEINWKNAHRQGAVVAVGRAHARAIKRNRT